MAGAEDAAVGLALLLVEEFDQRNFSGALEDSPSWAQSISLSRGDVNR